MNTRGMASKFEVVFVPGVGDLDYYCGVSESVYQIVRHMKKPPLVVTSGPHGLTQRLLAEGLPVRVVPFDGSMLVGFRNSGVLRKLRVASAVGSYAARLLFLLRRVGARVVYTANHATILAAYPVRLAGAKLVAGIRGSDGKFGKWARILRVSERIVLLSEEMRENLLTDLPPRARAFLGARMAVIRNGVSLNGRSVEPASAKATRGLINAAAEDVVVLYVAAFRAWKGQLRFLQDVAPRVAQELMGQPRVHYVFLGSATSPTDYGYETACRRAAEKLESICSTHFLGYQEDPWRWYAACDIVALASEHEGMSRATIEAMTAGRPVVTYDVCSARELLDHGAGVVIPQGDSAAMARAIADLAKRPEVRRDMGEKGKKFAEENLRIEAVSRAYERLFEEVLDQRGGRCLFTGAKP